MKTESPLASYEQVKIALMPYTPLMVKRLDDGTLRKVVRMLRGATTTLEHVAVMSLGIFPKDQTDHFARHFHSTLRNLSILEREAQSRGLELPKWRMRAHITKTAEKIREPKALFFPAPVSSPAC